jgi:hypothetical protein
MRRFLSLFIGLMAMSLLGAAPCPIPAHQDQPELLQAVESTVFITRTGNRYHLGGCEYLRRSSIAVALSAAKNGGYTPCHVCRPPE